MKKMFTLFVIFLQYFQVLPQEIVEKTFDVSKKAKKGFLGGVEYNKDKETFDMYYMVSSFFESAGYAHSSIWGNGMSADIPCEVYCYDKELNEKGEYKTGVRPDSYDWANFKGYFTYQTIQGMLGLGGINFKKIENTYRYDPSSGEYSISNWKVIEKEKPMQSNGTTYSWLSGVEVYNVTAERSSLMILGKKVEKSDATKKNNLHWYNHMMKYDIVHCDFNMNTTATDSFGFDFVNMKLFSGQIKDKRPAGNDEIARDWVVIYGPPMHNTPLYKSSKPTEWTYIRISPKGKIKDKIVFDSPVNMWRVDGVYEHDNTVYMYGPGIVEKSEKNYFFNLVDKKDEVDHATHTHYQIAKISNGKFELLKAYSLNEMQEKMLKPSNQKTALKLSGKFEESTSITVSENGEFFISHQNFETAKDRTSHIHKIYRNMFMFQFDAAGNIKKNYGIELAEIKAKDDYINSLNKPANNYFYTSGDGKKLYWFISSPKEMAYSYRSVETGDGVGGTYDKAAKTYRALRGIDYTSINIENGELSEMKTIWNDKKEPFYLFGTVAARPVLAYNYVYLFGENENEKSTGGDKMRITRVDISK